jgi:putative phosphoesterase
MRIAALYDIHGNLPALEAVLEEIRARGADRVVIGGDVLPGPMPRETLERLLDLDLPSDFILGNGDRAVLDELAHSSTGIPEQFREILRHSAREILPAHAELLAAWPNTLRIEIPDLGEVMFCHATPRSDTDIFSRFTSEDRLLPVFQGLGVEMVVCGHTHMQFDRMIGGVRVVNAGSVGMPYGEPGAYWALLGPGVDFRHTAYDLAEAAERVGRTSFPDAHEFAAQAIEHPPSEAEMLEGFAAAESK